MSLGNAAMKRLLLWLVLASVVAVFSPTGVVLAEVGDILFTRKTPGTAEIPPALFPHYSHRMQFKCYVCHDSITVMKAGANNIVMDDIQAGKYCGTCHNGKLAFQATFESCPRCHRS
jgi:c(7)-type cytochrome triheme protein